jgi:hypothetical protein
MDVLLLLVACWLERVYLATGFPGSITYTLSKSVTVYYLMEIINSKVPHYVILRILLLPLF